MWSARRGQGAGRLALGELINEAERRGFWKLVSWIFPDHVDGRWPGVARRTSV
jgi:L-amino acid N-acyltransferase YncA